MGTKYPQNIEKRPKRRRSKDNPYIIYSKKGDDEILQYYVSFRDAQGSFVCVEIEKEIFDAFDRFELDDLSYLNEVERHYKLSEIPDDFLSEYLEPNNEVVEDVVYMGLMKEKLRTIINELPELQRRRLILYFYEGYTYEQIAKIEGCTKSAVKFSLDKAVKNIRDGVNKYNPKNKL